MTYRSIQTITFTSMKHSSSLQKSPARIADDSTTLPTAATPGGKKYQEHTAPKSRPFPGVSGAEPFVLTKNGELDLVTPADPTLYNPIIALKDVARGSTIAGPRRGHRGAATISSSDHLEVLDID